jgi:hypothetical protein
MEAQAAAISVSATSRAMFTRRTLMFVPDGLGHPDTGIKIHG